MSESFPSDHDPSPSAGKLRKIPPIPVRRDSKSNAGDSDSDSDADSDSDLEHDLTEEFPLQPDDSCIIMASSLGLNHIRTRSAPLPLRTSAVGTPSNLGDNSRNNVTEGTNSEPKVSSTELGMSNVECRLINICMFCFFFRLCFGAWICKFEDCDCLIRG